MDSATSAVVRIAFRYILIIRRIYRVGWKGRDMNCEKLSNTGQEIDSFKDRRSEWWKDWTNEHLIARKSNPVRSEREGALERLVLIRDPEWN